MGYKEEGPLSQRNAGRKKKINAAFSFFSFLFLRRAVRTTDRNRPFHCLRTYHIPKHVFTAARKRKLVKKRPKTAHNPLPHSPSLSLSLSLSTPARRFPFSLSLFLPRSFNAAKTNEGQECISECISVIFVSRCCCRILRLHKKLIPSVHKAKPKK